MPVQIECGGCFEGSTLSSRYPSCSTSSMTRRWGVGSGACGNTHSESSPPNPVESRGRGSTRLPCGVKRGSGRAARCDAGCSTEARTVSAMGADSARGRQRRPRSAVESGGIGYSRGPSPLRQGMNMPVGSARRGRNEAPGQASDKDIAYEREELPGCRAHTGSGMGIAARSTDG